MKMTRNVKKAYTCTALLAPILNMYGISEKFNTFTIREIAILIMLLFCTIDTIRRKGLNITRTVLVSAFFIVCLFFSLVINSINGEYGAQLRVIRCILLYCYVFFFAEDYFDYTFGIRLYKMIAIFASLFVLAQVICANFFSYPLKGYFDFLPIRSKDLLEANLLRRYYSIFEEPGYFGMYCSGYILVSLFLGKREYLTIGLIAIAGLLTTATTSIVCIAFVITLYLLFSGKNTQQNKSRGRWRIKAAIILVAFVAFYVFINSKQFETVVYRLTKETSTQDRFEGYKTSIKTFAEYQLLIKLFGNGMTEYPISGYVAIIMAYGVIGTIGLLWLMTTCFTATNRIGKMLILLFLIINIGNVEFMGNASILLVFFGFILGRREKTNDNILEGAPVRRL